MRLQTLGGLSLTNSSFTRAKPLLLLSYLAIEGPQTRRQLADLFFFEAKNPRDALSTTFRRLKSLSEDLIKADADELATTISCDAKELLEAVDQTKYELAQGIYQGTFLKGLDLSLGEELEDWVLLTREYLAARVRETQLRLSESLIKQGSLNKAALLTEQALNLEGATELEPDDYARAYSILALAKSPKAKLLKAEAETFGIHLQKPVKATLHGSSAEKPFALPHNLSAPTSSFVGRDPELVEMATLLAEPHVRLITLHGPGGIGKSRLALQIALDQLHEEKFKDGIYFVPLDALTASEQIPIAIASAIGLSLDAKQEPLEQIARFLKHSEILLILDNYEHLIKEVSIVAKLIQACPKLILVVTSRERLNLNEEHVFSLKGLSLASEAEVYEKAIYRDALQLLSQRAKRVKLDFELTPELFPAAVKLCELLEGSPLGIELAIAWIRLLPLSEILTEVEKNLDFLESSAKNVSSRHKSLRAVFENSWRLLLLKEQFVLQKLAVFRGGFRREAASSIAGATLAILANLVDKSLIKVLPEGRYSSHVLLHHFSFEKLAEQAENQRSAQLAHAGYYRDFAKKADAFLRGSDQEFWLSRLEEEYDNLAAALTFCLEAQALDLGLSLVASLGSFWEMRGRFLEGRTWCKRYLQNSASLPRTKTRAKVLSNAAWLAFLQGDYREANLLQKESLNISEELNDQQGMGNAFTGLGIFSSDQGDYLSARLYFEKSLAISKVLADQQGIAALLNNLGILHSHLADYALAEDYHKQSLALRKLLGDKRGVGFALNNLGSLAHLQTDFKAAQSFYAEGLEIKQALGDTHGVAGALDNLGIISTELGDFVKAKAYFAKAIKLMLELGDKRGVSNCLQNLGSLRAFEGLPQEAATLWGAAEALRENRGIPHHAHDLSRQVNEKISAVRELLGKDRFNHIWREGKKLDLEEAVSYALAEEKTYEILPESF